MSGLSKCLNSSLLYFNKSSSHLFKAATNASSKQIVATQARASHGRNMFIRPGKFYTKKFFDIIVSEKRERENFG